MATTSTLKIGIAQYACSAVPAENLEKAQNYIRTLAQMGAEVVLLPELFKSVYFCHEEDYPAFELAETTDSADFGSLKALCQELGVSLFVPYFEQRARGLYHNSLAVLDPQGQVAAHYRKTHIPDDPGFYEKFYFTPGDSGFMVYEQGKASLGALICWDQWFPEGARCTALKGAELIYYPTAIGWHESQDEATNQVQFEAWRTIQRSHAIANGVFTVGVNRTGKEGELQFWGGSFVYGPFGQLLWEAPHYEEAAGVVEIDLGLIDVTRQHWPFLRDRRPDRYQEILRQYLS